MFGLFVYGLLAILIFIILLYPKFILNIFMENYDYLTYTYNSTDQTMSTYTYKGYEIFCFNEQSQNENEPICIYMTGGLFFYTKPEIAIVEQFSKDRLVYTFNYPSLSDHKVTEIDNFIMEIISDFIIPKHKNRQFCLVLTSAAAIYSFSICEKFKDLIKKIITINGYFGYRSTSTFLFKMLSKIYLGSYSDRNLKITSNNNTEFHCLLNEDDFIKECSQSFANANTINVVKFPGDHFEFSKRNENSKEMIKYLNSII